MDFVSTLITYFNTQDDVEIIATAKDGQEAFNKIITERPTVALLDVIMPHLDGLGVLEKLISSNVGLPICVMLSAVGQDAVTAQAINLGARYYVLKPFKMDVLMKRIRELVNEPLEKPKQNQIMQMPKEEKTNYVNIKKEATKEEK
jgi:two-component system response regulator (stage 0 sporulation protein A)